MRWTYLRWLPAWGLMLLPAPRVGAADAALGLDVASARLWRGVVFNSSPVLAPALTLSHFSTWPLEITVDGVIDIGDEGGRFDAEGFSELQLGARLKLPAGLQVAYAELLYPGPHKPRGFGVTREASLGWSWRGSIEPSVTVVYDVDQIDDGFVVVGLARSFTLSERTQLALEGESGYAGKRYAAIQGAARGGFQHYDLGVRVTFLSTDRLRLTARAAYAGTWQEALPKQPLGFHANIGVTFLR
jgi:hypothetical protein